MPIVLSKSFLSILYLSLIHIWFQNCKQSINFFNMRRRCDFILHLRKGLFVPNNINTRTAFVTDDNVCYATYELDSLPLSDSISLQRMFFAFLFVLHSIQSNQIYRVWCALLTSQSLVLVQCVKYKFNPRRLYFPSAHTRVHSYLQQ